MRRGPCGALGIIKGLAFFADKRGLNLEQFEIKILKLLNQGDLGNQKRVVRLLDHFYHKEHLFLVFELLGQNLYEFYKALKTEAGSYYGVDYFSFAHLRSVARQILAHWSMSTAST